MRDVAGLAKSENTHWLWSSVTEARAVINQLVILFFEVKSIFLGACAQRIAESRGSTLEPLTVHMGHLSARGGADIASSPAK